MKKTNKKMKKKREVSELLAIVSLLINLLLMPGLGSIIGGKTKEGISQLAILIGGVIFGIIFIVSLILIIPGIIMVFTMPLIAWIWGIITGINLIKESR
jgi:hypothetical protein